MKFSVVPSSCLVSLRLLTVCVLAFCATPRLSAQNTIFFEGFENGLGTWEVGDANTDGPPAYWGIVTNRFGGVITLSSNNNFMAYCAGIGYGGTASSPNYRPDMSAYLRRSIDLTGYTNATLSFWYRILSIEGCVGCDNAQVLIDDTVVWSRNSQVPNWSKVVISLESFVGGPHTLRFLFNSDFSVEREGWYLDDILITDAYTPGPPPANDNFVNAQPLVGATGSLTAANGSSTFETGEPANGFSATNSVWFRWTAITNGPVTFRTGGSSFDTVLCVYTGGSVGALTPVACDDNGDTNNASFISFNAVQSTIYRIQVRGANNARGTIKLAWSQPNGVGVELLPDIGLWADQSQGYLYDWYIDRNEPTKPGRTLLRASTSSLNTGTGPLELRGSSLTPGVNQRIYSSDGGYREVYAGTFTFHPGHQHLHFDNWLNFRLREVLTGNGVGEIVVAGDKTSFAIIDLVAYNLSLPGAPPDRVYREGVLTQGISVGWSDVYSGALLDQWIDVTGVPPGRYWLEAVVDPDNRVIESNETNNTVRILIELPSFVNVPNDHFTNAIVLSGASASAVGSNVGATKENNEPTHRPGNAGGASIWYRWTAPSNMNVVVSTEGSSIDTVVAVYTGSSVQGLNQIVWNDDSGIGPTSLTNFTALAGITYRIAVDGYFAADENVVQQGGIHLSINPAWNNDLNRAISISGMSGSVSGNNRGATRQAGEPLHAGVNGTNSIWYTWTAPTNGPFTFDTAGSSFDTLLAVYTDSAFPLTLVAADDNSGPFNTSRVNFDAVSNTTYRIAVDGVPGDLAIGVARLNWNGPRPPTIITQPVATNRMAGSTVQFRVAVDGSAPFGYQWRHAGVNLVDDGNYIQGSTTPTLTLGKIFADDGGAYTVVITNAYGAVTSTVANLIVLDNPRVVYINPGTAPIAGTAVVPLRAQAVGDESVYKFSISFDPALLGNPRISPGADAPGANFVLNNNQISSGRLGVTMNLPIGFTLPPSSTLELAKLYFDTSPSAPVGTQTVIGFPDQPVSKTIISTTGANMSGLFSAGAITLENWNAAAAGQFLPNGTFQLSLNGPPNHTYVIEASTNLTSGIWSPVSTNTTSATGLLQFIDTTASTSPHRFFRARMVQ